MLPECRLVRLLDEIARSSAKQGAVGLSLVARSALNIIADASNESLMPADIDCLVDLIDEFANEGHAELRTYLQEDIADCPICTALAMRFSKR